MFASLAGGKWGEARQQAEQRFTEVRSLAKYLLYDVYDRLERTPQSLAMRRDVARVAQRLFPAGTTSLSSLGIPVIAIVASWLQLGEEPGKSELIGMLLIGIALALLSYLSIRRHEEPEPMTGQE